MKKATIICRLYALLFAYLFVSAAGKCQTIFPEKSPIFKDDVVASIDLIIPHDSLDEIFAPGNEESDHHFLVTFHFDNGEIRDTLENVGFRLRGNTSRYSAKKSFKISFNTYNKGRKWFGVEKLNLNGEHNDPTVSRSKVCWDLLREFKVPAPRASHVRLYINNLYYGVYAIIEHIDENFIESRFGNNNGNLYKCLWPADLVYKGDNPELYKTNNGSRRTYDLKINNEIDDYSDLAHFIGVLNNTSIEERPCELEAVFNVNSYLRVMAFDILSGNWDGPLYNKNNFYLYHNEETGQFEYIPYDLDNTFGIDWFQINWATRDIYNWKPSNEPRPLYESILEVEEYRDLFSYYLNIFIAQIFNEEKLYPKIETIKSLIQSAVAEDPFYPLDYGFDLGDFNKSFDEPLSVFHTPIGLKTFISQRINSSLDQLELNEISPIISNISNNLPISTDNIRINAFVEDDQNDTYVEVCYRWDDSADIECIEMYDNGQHQDGQPNDGNYGTLIDDGRSSGLFTYYILATDKSGNKNQKPRCGTIEMAFESSSVTLAINEIMASNNATIADENGEFDDWIEVTNFGKDSIFLGGRYLSDKADQPTKWAMPNIWIQPNEFLLFWADEDGEQGDMHANFKLSASGEFIGIYDLDKNNNKLIDGLEFGPQSVDEAYGRIPNGTGSFQPLNPSPGASNKSTSSTENFNEYTFKTFPNPFSQFITIDFPQSGRNKLNIVIFNSSGEAVLEQSLSNDQNINTSNLSPGLYFITIRENGYFLHLKKMVKGF